MTTLLRKYPWALSLLVGAVWIAGVIDARNQIRALTTAIARLTAPPPVITSPAPATSMWLGVSDVDLDVRPTGERSYEISRATVDAILRDLGRLTRSTRVVPEIRDGRASGFRLYGVPVDGPLGRLGFRSGDRVLAINGLAISSPEQALEAYARLKTAPFIAVAIERNGERITNSYRIR